MSPETLPENPYVLLTPGPLITTPTVKAAMLRDWCTWDDEYNAIGQDVRRQLVKLATPKQGYTSVLMQGSGPFCVEATLGSAVPPGGRIPSSRMAHRPAHSAHCRKVAHTPHPPALCGNRVAGRGPDPGDASRRSCWSIDELVISQKSYSFFIAA